MKTASFTKSYDGRMVLRMPELSFQPGTIYAVIGANGSGKSTCAKVLSGITLPDLKQRVLPPPCAVGYMPQHSYAFRMSTMANVCLARGDKLRAEKLMRALKIDHLAHQRANRLSGGELARMALARVLMKRYDLLILDEPTAAMDIESTALAEEQVLTYCKETGCTVLLVTHNLQQARRMAEEVLFLYQGNLLENGKAEQILSQPMQSETRQFLEFYGIL